MRYLPSRSTVRVAPALLALTWPLAGGACSRPAQTGSANAARTPEQVLIAIVKPPVFWRESREDEGRREIAADPKTHGMYRLPAGSWVCCGPGGKVKLFLTPQVEVYEGEEWRPLPHLSEPQRELVDEAGVGLFRTAGRLRANDSLPIFSPQENSTVWPASLVFQWAPLPAGKKVALALRTIAAEETLWEADGIDGAAGQHVAPQARAALRRWRDKHGGGEGRLELVFRVSKGPRLSVPCDVLTPENEQELERALARWDSETKGLLRHLGRAEVFFRKELLPESAAEYELALKLDPGDPLVRQRTVQANWMIGNAARAEQLERRKDLP